MSAVGIVRVHHSVPIRAHVLLLAHDDGHYLRLARDGQPARDVAANLGWCQEGIRCMYAHNQGVFRDNGTHRLEELEEITGQAIMAALGG